MEQGLSGYGEEEDEIEALLPSGNGEEEDGIEALLPSGNGEEEDGIEALLPCYLYRQSKRRERGKGLSESFISLLIFFLCSLCCRSKVAQSEGWRH